MADPIIIASVVFPVGGIFTLWHLYSKGRIAYETAASGTTEKVIAGAIVTGAVALIRHFTAG